MQTIKAKLLEPGMNIFLEKQNKVAEVKQVKIDENVVMLVFKIDEKFYRHRFALNADVMLAEAAHEEEYDEEEVIEEQYDDEEQEEEADEAYDEEDEEEEEEEEEEVAVVAPPVREQTQPAPKPAPRPAPVARQAAPRPAPSAAPVRAVKARPKYVFGKTWATAVPHISSLTLTGLIYATLGLGLLAIPVFLIVGLIDQMYLLIFVGFGVLFVSISFAVILLFLRTFIYNHELQIIARNKDE